MHADWADEDLRPSWERRYKEEYTIKEFEGGGRERKWSKEKGKSLLSAWRVWPEKIMPASVASGTGFRKMVGDGEGGTSRIHTKGEETL